MTKIENILISHQKKCNLSDLAVAKVFAFHSPLVRNFAVPDFLLNFQKKVSYMPETFKEMKTVFAPYF